MSGGRRGDGEGVFDRGNSPSSVGRASTRETSNAQSKSTGLFIVLVWKNANEAGLYIQGIICFR